MKKQILSFFLLLVMVGISSCRKEVATADYKVIPLPREISLNPSEGEFLLNGKTVITYPAGDDMLLTDAKHLQSYIKDITGHELKIMDSPRDNDAINLNVKPDENNPEGYKILVTPEQINIEGASSAGAFYGIQTLRKSIPIMEGKYDVLFPAASIVDFPRFAYRGAHFDVSRHFFPQDSVKKFIDILALHNINTLHWHLTDDQGWRVEIKKHPRLTEIGSKRKGTVIGHNSGEYDSIPVEGFYTQDQIKEIIKYAADRHITIIPEIDLPGHMLAALTAYPELGCTGGPYDVWQKWGVSDEVLCAGNDSVYLFIEDVLDEISDLFPSKYVHIGGDECPKIRWEECTKCQLKIKELGLKTDNEGKAEDKLQSHVMKHSEDFLRTKGKNVIGWDEILEGGISPNATIMSWRGEEGGIIAAQKGNDVIMTPNTYLYFDYYQTLDRENEPMAIGGYVPLEKVYNYEPIPSSFSEEEASHIIGVQANLWTEYIKTFPHAVYMELPRMAALSEVQWTEGNKDYDNFMMRLPSLMAHYKANGYPYSLRAYDISGKIDVNQEDNTLSFNLSAPLNGEIYYTLDGSVPSVSSNKYEGPIKVSQDTKLRAIGVYPFGTSAEYKDSVSFNKATGHRVSLLTKPAPKFARDPSMLTNGKTGSEEWKSEDWIGYYGGEGIMMIDLQNPMNISSVGANFMVDTPSHIFDIRKMSVSVSNDGENWKEVASDEYPALTESTRKINSHKLNFPDVEARYVKVSFEAENSVPEWHPIKNQKGFFFVDEISIY